MSESGSVTLNLFFFCGQWWTFFSSSLPLSSWLRYGSIGINKGKAWNSQPFYISGASLLFWLCDIPIANSLNCRHSSIHIQLLALGNCFSGFWGHSIQEMLRAVKTICVGGGGAGAVNTLSRMRRCMYVCPRERALLSQQYTEEYNAHSLLQYKRPIRIFECPCNSFWPQVYIVRFYKIQMHV